MNIIELAPWFAIAITLILSILVPVFTQKANNRFQIKLKKLEYINKEAERKINAYEEYFQKVGGCVLYAQKENISDAGASIQRLYAYLPEDNWDLLDSLFDSIKAYEWDIAKQEMKKVSKIIASDIHKIKYSF